jgi:hypothetical protein
LKQRYIKNIRKSVISSKIEAIIASPQSECLSSRIQTTNAGMDVGEKRNL